jgi:hypothetical protein
MQSTQLDEGNDKTYNTSIRRAMKNGAKEVMKSAFVRIMLTYFILLIGLMIMLIPTYVQIYHRYETQCVEENRLLLEAGIRNFASDMSRLSTLTLALRKESQINRLCQLKQAFQPKHCYWMEMARMKLEQSLNMFTRTPDLIA